MKRIGLATLAVAALLSAMPLAAQTKLVAPPNAKTGTTRTADLRCLLLASEMVGAGDAAQKEAGQKAALYYVGKLLGREPGLDLSAVSKTEIVAMEKMDRRAGLQRCGAELQLTAIKVRDAGEAMAAMAQPVK